MGGLESGVGGGVEVMEERGEFHAHFEWVSHGGSDVSEGGWCSPGATFWVDCLRCLWLWMGV
jgi:hypothetical protein